MHSSHFLLPVEVLPRLLLWTIVLANHLSCSSVVGFVLPPPSPVYSTSLWPYNFAAAAVTEPGDGVDVVTGQSSSSSTSDGNHDEWSLKQLLLALSSVGVTLHPNSDEKNGGRVARSCNHYNTISMYTSACSNFKRSVATGSKAESFPSTPPQKRVSDQGGPPDFGNVIAVDYYIPAPAPPSSHPPSFLLPSEPTSNHMNNNAGGGWFHHGSESGAGPYPATPEKLDPELLLPLLSRVENQRSFETTQGGGGAASPASPRLIIIMEKPSRGEAAGGVGGGGVEQKIDPLVDAVFMNSLNIRDLPRRAPARKEELYRIANKCCSEGCDEKDFFPFC